MKTCALVFLGILASVLGIIIPLRESSRPEAPVPLAPRKVVVVEQPPGEHSVIGTHPPAGPERIVTVAPPPPRRESIPPPPSPNHVWIDGYWYWNGRVYIWVAGGWHPRPRGRTVWVSGHWDPRGDGYVWTPGFWR